MLHKRLQFTFPEMGFRKRVACGTVESLTRAGDPGVAVIRADSPHYFSAGAL